MANKYNDHLESLLDHTYTENDLQKEKTWKAIESELDFGKPKKRLWIGIVVTTAACLLLAVGLMTTTTGHAIVDKVKEMFEPEKEVNIPMEGTNEEETATLNDNSEHGYVIYVDESHYKMEKQEHNDIIVPSEPLPENIPDVFMKIIHQNDSVENTITQLEDERNITFEQTEYPINAFVARSLEGNKWDSVINRYYVVSDEHNGSYIFHQRFFLEAEEGHGVRLDEMLKDFHIIEE